MIKVSGGQLEDGTIIGNTYDKYGSKNRLVRRIMHRFDRTLGQFVQQASPRTIHEVGCGEGYWVLKWTAAGIDARGTDFSAKVVDIARENARNSGVAPERFTVRDIYDVRSGDDSADLIVCCEVLEHLTDPRRALRALATITRREAILSVPREPLWRALNLTRGAYVNFLGNTPGHLNHWSRRGFASLVSEYFDVVSVASPVPWTMVRCRRRDR